MNGGRGWDRTSDPCDVNAVLIPLSYAPCSSEERRSFYIGWDALKATRAGGKDQAASIRST